MVSIIIPCYNEADKIFNNIIKVNLYLRKVLTENYEIILCNDGSIDNTLIEIKRLKNEIKEIKILNNLKNSGKGYAIKMGMLYSKGEKVIFMDADLATDLIAIPEALELLEYHDIVIGSRRITGADIKVKQPFHRRLIGKSCSIITNIITALYIQDTQCGFKAFNKKTINPIFTRQTINGFAFDVEILYIAKLLGYSIKEIPVIWRNGDTSTVRAVKDSMIFIKMLLTIRKNNRNYQETIN